MSDLVVIIPTRNRSQAVPEMIESFRESCREDTSLIFAVDADDPELEAYSSAVRNFVYSWQSYEERSLWSQVHVCVVDNPTNMVGALNKAATSVLILDNPKAIAFM